MSHNTDRTNAGAAAQTEPDKQDAPSNDCDATANSASADSSPGSNSANSSVSDANFDDATDDSPDSDDNVVPFADATAAALDAENARLREAVARALADLENYRRRVAREKEELRKYANQNLLEDLVPVLDNFVIGLDAAAKHPEAAPVVSGFKMIAAQIKSVLEQNGLVEINPHGQPFDPHFHESVSQTPHDTIPDHHVAAVLRVGYRLQDRLVRPATVILSTGPAIPADTDTAAPEDAPAADSSANPPPAATADTAASAE